MSWSYGAVPLCMIIAVLHCANSEYNLQLLINFALPYNKCSFKKNISFEWVKIILLHLLLDALPLKKRSINRKSVI